VSDSAPYVYDKAKYHYESVEQAGLPQEHASNHTVPILRWLIEHNLMSDFFVNEGAEPLANYRNGELSIHELYQWWDTCLISDMLSEEGNAFAIQYFDFTHGKYISDYKATLQGKLPTEFHIVYSEAGYEKLRAVIDRRFAEWRQSSPKSWWQFRR
jgi:hypothetical protein